MKSKESFLKKITEQLNQHEYSNLTKFLEQIDWFSIPHEQIVPREKVRAFIKSIENEETRLNVARFLQKYEDYYFKEPDNGFTTDFGTDPIAEFHRELEFLIKQLTSNGEFSDDKFSKLQKRITDLEKQVNELKVKNAKLEAKMDIYENPQDYGFGITGQLERQEFYWIMKYLVGQRVARVKYVQTEWGQVPGAYHWDKEMGLFGYFVDQVSDFLDLRDSADRIKWEPFKKAFLNFDKLEKEARNAISRYKTPHGKYPDNGDLVRNAIKYAQEKAQEEESKK